MSQGLALVTGANGFLGSHVVRSLLREGYRVRAMAGPTSDLKNLEGLPLRPFRADLRDEASLRDALRGVRWVFHAAAEYRLYVRDASGMNSVNVAGTRRLLELSGLAGVERIVYTSSVSTIPPREDSLPADETRSYSDPEEIVGAYKKSKFLAEREALRLSAIGLPVVVVNPAAPVGPFDRKPTPTGKIVLDFLNGRMPAYVDTGLNVVHAEDVAHGHVLALERGRVGERYILGGENLTLKAVLDSLAGVAGLPTPRLRLPYAAAYAAAWVDTTLLSWGGREPRAPLDGVRMSKRPMYYSSAKAADELGYHSRPAVRALEDAARWYAREGRVERPVPAL